MTAADWAARYARSKMLTVLPLHWIADGGRCSCRRSACSSQGKHPLTGHGKDDASAAPDVVAGWWSRWPRANVGLRPPNGMVVLDVDPRNGGDESLAELEQRHGLLPPTLTARTGSGGRHLWLRHTGPVPGRLAPGIDIKSNAGYLVAPPSLHASGGTYRWTDERAAAPAPDWLRALLAPQVRPACPRLPVTGSATLRSVAGVLGVVVDAREGGRNNALSWASYALFQKVRAGDLEEVAVAAMLTDAAAMVRLPDDEAAGTIASARRKVLGR